MTSSSSSSASAASFQPVQKQEQQMVVAENLPPPAAAAMQQQQLVSPAAEQEQEQLCYVHCHYCDTVLVVSVPSSSLYKTVTVRCGHCSSLLTVNMMRNLLFPATTPPPPTTTTAAAAAAPPPRPPPPTAHLFPNSSLLLDQMSSTNQRQMLLEQHVLGVGGMMASVAGCRNNATAPPAAAPATATQGKGAKEPSPRTNTVINRPPEKRQRVPSAYNRFIKDEIQRIKAGNPDISHREAFSAAAKNWAHFPHIHFGLMPDHQGLLKRTSLLPQDHQRKDGLLKDGLYASAAAAAANMGVAPY